MTKIIGLKNGSYKHGMHGTPFYRIWSGMKSRCTNKDSRDYHYYGGRGIEICERWLSFENFHEDMYQNYIEDRRCHPGPRNTSIDRIDNESGYRPENCKWATRLEQSNNRRRYFASFKLTPMKVVNIRHCKGSISERRLASIHGLNRSTITDIWSRRSWPDAELLLESICR